jgi:DNA-binding response OmpR family regulator
MRILLAEDEGQLSRVLKMAMTTNNYTVDTAANGQEAVDLAQQNPYDVMIFDIMMPVKDGIEALKELRASGNHTYTIMLTAMAETDDKVNGLDAGADDYITKPFSLKELLARLRSLERRQDNYSQSTYSLGDTTVDTSEQNLSSSNSISLSKNETQLLVFLIANAKKELSTAEILNSNWGQQAQVNAADLWIYICYLRQKLAAVKSSLQIKGAEGGPYQLIGTGESNDSTPA